MKKEEDQVLDPVEHCTQKTTLISVIQSFFLVCFLFFEPVILILLEHTLLNVI